MAYNQQFGMGFYDVRPGEDPLAAAIRILSGTDATVGGPSQWDARMDPNAARQQQQLVQALQANRGGVPAQVPGTYNPAAAPVLGGQSYAMSQRPPGAAGAAFSSSGYQPQGAQGPMQTGQNGVLARMPDGTHQWFSDVGRLDQAIGQGAVPLGPQGEALTVTPFMGGNLLNGVPINVAMGQGWQPGQQEALQQRNAAPAQATAPQQAGQQPGTFPSAPVISGAPAYTNNQNIDPNTGLVDTGVTTVDGVDYQNPQYIPGMQLSAPDLVPQGFSGDTQRSYVDFMNNLTGQIGQQYDYNIPDAQAAQMAAGNVPQPSAAQQQISPEIQAMLAGQGYSPAMMAQLRSRATEDVAGAGRTALSQGKIALEQAGLGGSPAGAAIASDIARQSGQQQSAALRDIDIANAQEGLTNFRQGVGYQTQIGGNNMQAANAMALANANRLFESMSLNLANQQQANMASFGANVDRLGNQAGAKAGTLANQGQAYNQAVLGKAAQADETNVANRINWGLNQAGFDRDRQVRNQQDAFNRWQTGTTLGSFSPTTINYQGNQGTGFNPIAAALIPTGQSLINQGLNR